MNTQEPSKSPPQRRVEKERTREDRYYVQSLTAQIFLVRQYLSEEGKPGPDDHIIRSFDSRHDAYSYAASLNNGQASAQ
ncbi:MAG TPA: hypothetical protein VGD98_03885 [Ktedonobacteraceae bacterium]